MSIMDPRNLDTYNDGWEDHWEEEQSAYRAHLAALTRRGRRDAIGGAPTFFPIDQPLNRSAEYRAWRRGYDHSRRALVGRD